MKKGLIGIILASSLALPSCNNNLDPNSPELVNSTRSIIRQELKNPLLGKEAYELGPAGTYQCHLETEGKDGLPGACIDPFCKFKSKEGTLYLVRLDSERSFEKPVVAKKDGYDQSAFELGRYEVWIENKGHFAPIDRFDAVNENEKLKILKVYRLKEEIEMIGVPKYAYPQAPLPEK